MSVDMTVLAAEINNDPKHLGYAALVTAGNDNGVAVLLNATTGAGTGLLPREPVNASDFVSLIDPTELDTLTSTQKEDLQIYEAAGQVAIGEANVETWINNVFPSGNAPLTHAALSANFTRVASRGEVLFGANTNISSNDVATALGRP